MTIKIITRGVDPKTTPMRGTCRVCSTVVECAQGDVTHYYPDQRDYTEASYDYVACPICTAHITVKKYLAHDGRGPG